MSESIHYFIPAQVTFSAKQMRMIKRRWRDTWKKTFEQAEEEMTEEDVLLNAEALGFVKLPEGWKA